MTNHVSLHEETQNNQHLRSDHNQIDAKVMTFVQKHIIRVQFIKDPLVVSIENQNKIQV